MRLCVVYVNNIGFSDQRSDDIFKNELFFDKITMIIVAKHVLLHIFKSRNILQINKICSSFVCLFVCFIDLTSIGKIVIFYSWVKFCILFTFQ